jgi:hypothetical protein
MEKQTQLEREMEAREAKHSRRMFDFGAGQLIEKGEKAAAANPANAAKLEELRAAIATIKARDDQAFLDSRRWVGDGLDARAMIVEVLRAK